MSIGKAILYVVLGLLGLLVVSAVASLVFAAITFLWLIARLLVFLLAVGLVGYVGYKLYTWISGYFATGDELDATYSTDRSTTGVSDPLGNTPDPVEDLKHRYATGELSEAEFERKLDRALSDRSYDDIETLSDQSYDDIDRELQRDRV